MRTTILGNLVVILFAAGLGHTALATEGCDMRSISDSFTLRLASGGLAELGPDDITVVVKENVPTDPENLEPEDFFLVCLVDASGSLHCSDESYTDWVQ